VLVRARGVGKVFCRDLRRSLWYGLRDALGELLPRGSAAHCAAGGERALRRGEFWANRDISFEIRRGECLGLIGRNGAGKTTLLKMLNGLFKPDAGCIEIRGRVGALIALGAGFNPVLTGRENVYVNGSVLGLGRKEIDRKYDEIVAFADLAEFMDTPVQNYSSGMQVRLGFATAAVLVEPDVLLLDEVLAVGDASFQVKCVNAIRRLQARGVAIVLVSHNMHYIMRYCDKGLYLDGGRVVGCGDISEIAGRYLQDQDAGGAVDVVRDPWAGNVPTDSGIALDHVRLTDVDGRSIDTARSLDTVCLRVPYRLPKTMDARLVRLELAVDDAKGLFLQSVSEPLMFPGGAAGAEGEFVAEIRGLCANTGSLSIGIALWDAGVGGAMLAWSRNNRVDVANPRLEAGRAVCACSWAVCPVVVPRPRP